MLADHKTQRPQFREYVPSVRRAISPGIVRDWTEARHARLSLPRWRAAKLASLDLLPPTDPVDGAIYLDLGANVGDWTAAVLRATLGGEVIAAEPGARPLSELRRRFDHDPRVTIVPKAVAGSSGMRDFHVTQHSHNASLRAPRDMDEHYGHGWAVDEVTTVDATTVDALAEGRAVAVMKIDVQGAELDVLAGAGETLRRTAAVLLEVTFVSHYEHDASFCVLHERMTDLGFRLTGLSKPYMSAAGVVLWCDAGYARV